MKFNERLKMLRLGAGYSSAERFAKKIGMKPMTYRTYERGTRQPTLQSLVTICEGLGITPNHLFYLDKDVA